jgi:hypothetical protein
MKHVYIGIEILSATAAQRDTFIAALRALGPALDPQPSHRNHHRTRLDGQAVIIEAAFGDNDLTVANVQGFLANAFGVAANTITPTLSGTVYGPLVTFARGGINRVRFILFGGATPTHEESRLAAIAYLLTNRLEWEPEEG